MSRRNSARTKIKKLPPLKGKPFELRGRIWFDGKDGTFLGHGRVALMESIKEHGSISQAAKALGMSYRHAWRLVDSMNRQTPHPFVVTSKGGESHGGAVVTEHGERAIKLFRKLDKEFREFLSRKTAHVSFD